jgi:Domain of unknown function (DUF4377)
MKLHWSTVVPVALVLAACSSARVTEKTLEVAAQTVKCQMSFEGWRIVADTEPNAETCVQLREPGTMPYLPHQVKGFAFETGNTYTIKVRETQINDGRMDVHPTLELIAILEKTPASK